MMHHPDNLRIACGALLLILGIVNSICVAGRKLKPSFTWYALFYAILGVSNILGGSYASGVQRGASDVTAIAAVGIGGVAAVLRIKEGRSSRKMRANVPPAPDSHGPQFRGYLTKPRM